MRVLLSTIGSRGDFQPLLALGVQLRELGHEARLCAPPDFRGLAEEHGLPFVPLGPELQPRAGTADKTPNPTPKKLTIEELRALVPATVAGQFATVGEAAEGCDVIVGCNQLQVAARSVAELRGIRYFFADYSPVSLPSPHHAPPPLPGRPPAEPGADDRALWTQEIERRNATWRTALNEQRAAAGLGPVDDVLGHILTDRPLLAADPALAPWLRPSDVDVVPTGAWILPDRRPLPSVVEDFLADGEPPVYFGFGSVRSPQALGRAAVEAARALGRRAIVLRGWAGLDLPDDGPDCLAVTELNLRALFPRVAAVVHHGGAGTTTTASRGGAPQVVVPHLYDQYYFARRVQDLGIGAAHADAEPTADSLATALKQVLQSDVESRARSFAAEVRTDGALVAARFIS
ncbi:glycosyltransferase [Amycolatopsis sp. NBC_00345]|uniref:glycosyltransferase n=1 Tax=Amycolatopsis sp. NBC_00345 TaxID=2975955 RepID=UPI002E2642D0